MLKFDIFFYVIAINSVFLIATIFKFGKIDNIPGIANTKIIKYIQEHNSLKLNNVSYFTLPSNDNAYSYLDNSSFLKTNWGRGRVNCSHFESEISCNQELISKILFNTIFNSNKKIYLQLSGNFQNRIRSLQFAFLSSILTNRKLYITSKINTYFENNISIAKAPKNATTVKCKASRKCSLSFLQSFDDDIVLKGVFDPRDILLNPNFANALPSIIRTHSLYLISLFTFRINEINLDKNTLFIGVLGSEYNADVSLLHEGYEKYVIKRFKKLDQKSATFLLNCDLFVGTFDEFESHYITAVRGRGSKYIFKEKIIELGSSQSIGNLNSIRLESPDEIETLKHYVTFSGL